MSYKTATSPSTPRIMTQGDIDRLYATAFSDGYSEGRGDEKDSNPIK